MYPGNSGVVNIIPGNCDVFNVMLFQVIVML